MKNKLSDLNNHLFAELERLGDEDLKGDDLKAEVERAKSISDVANKIIDNAHLQLSAVKLQAEYGTADIGLKGLLEVKNE